MDPVIETVTAESALPSVAGHWLLDGVLSLPAWLSLLIVSLIVAGRIGFAGFVLAKTGRSPLWALVLMVPLAEILAVWALAYARWPRWQAGPADDLADDRADGP